MIQETYKISLPLEKDGTGILQKIDIILENVRNSDVYQRARGVYVKLLMAQVPLKEGEDIDKRLGKSLFLLNDDNIHMSEYWEMMIIDKEKVLFAPFYEGRFLISVSYDRIVEALADWCESRMQVANVDVMQNSRQ